MSTDPSMLDGGTQPPYEGSYPATPGEFAARWNTADEPTRQRVVTTMNEAHDAAWLCRVLDHRGELDMRRAQVGAVTRLHRHPDGDDPASTYCAHDDETWPCPTMRALGVTS